jgi:HD-GYP domain-containing protein (c-di-GMP phosphodiesterase class II)
MNFNQMTKSLKKSYDDLKQEIIGHKHTEELTLAYDVTIKGWSRALDLRDKETEGHSQRVAEVTVELAQAFGIKEEELMNIRRRALLHDIGKMAIPDNILLKPAPLTEEEWIIMRKHPEYAHQLLSPITYLRHALDIPYCHHERRDDSGYPQGLKGEQIPLAARIFAVVDVYDALSFARPYRPAWQEDKVIEYIKSLSGILLDPRVVELFLKMKQ